MPVLRGAGGKPVVTFDPLAELSPFTLFRRLSEERAPLLVDARRRPTGYTLEGALPFPGEQWRPPAPDVEVLFFDDDSSEAGPWVARLRAEGFERVRALFGGLELYRFALDPEVVGRRTYLVELGG